MKGVKTVKDSNWRTRAKVLLAYKENNNFKGVLFVVEMEIDKTFRFQVVQEDRFSKILKIVQRRREAEKEEKEWLSISSNSKNKVQSNDSVSTAECWVSELERKASKITPLTEKVSSYEDFHGLTKGQCELKRHSTNSATAINVTGEKSGTAFTDIFPIKPRSCRSDDPGDLNIADSPFVSRVKYFRMKIAASLDDITRRIDEIPEPDGAEDLAKRKHREIEFGSRFYRNYVYQLQREVGHLEKQWRSTGVNNQSEYFCHKMITAHQLSLNGLQAYYQHMPNSVGIAVPMKLKKLLSLIIKLDSFYKNFDIGIDEIDLESKCVSITDLMNSRLSECKGKVCKPTHCQTMKKSTTSRLYMYLPSLRLKKPVTSATAKLNPRLKETTPLLRQKKLHGNVALSRSTASAKCQKVLQPGKKTLEPMKTAKSNVDTAKNRKNNTLEKVNDDDNVPTLVETVSHDNLQEELLSKHGNGLKMPVDPLETIKKYEEKHDAYNMPSETSLLHRSKSVNTVDEGCGKPVNGSKFGSTFSLRNYNRKQPKIIEPRPGVRLEMCVSLDYQRECSNEKIMSADANVVKSVCAHPEVLKSTISDASSREKDHLIPQKVESGRKMESEIPNKNEIDGPLLFTTSESSGDVTHQESIQKNAKMSQKYRNVLKMLDAIGSSSDKIAVDISKEELELFEDVVNDIVQELYENEFKMY